jgi:hypothetical protein
MENKRSNGFRDRLRDVRENGKLIYEHTADRPVGDPITGYLGTHGDELCVLRQYSDSDANAFAVWLEEAMDDNGPLADLSEAVWLVFWMWTDGSVNEFLANPSLRCFGPSIDLDGEGPVNIHGSIPDEYINFAGLLENITKILDESHGIKNMDPIGPSLQMADLDELFRVDRKTIHRRAKADKRFLFEEPAGSHRLYNLRSALIVLGSCMDSKHRKLVEEKYPETWEWYESRSRGHSK